MGRVGRVCAQPATDPLRGSQVGCSSGGIGFEWSWNPPETIENRRDLARFGQDPMRSSWIWQIFLQIRWFFSQIMLRIARFVVFMPDLIVLVDEIYEIKLKSRRKAGEFARMFMLFGRVGFHGFWRRGLETDPPALGFGARDPRLTTGAVGSMEAGRVRAG